MRSNKRILVPLDFSPGALEILETADRLADSEEGSLVLLHVLEAFDAMRQRPPVILSDILNDYARLVRRVPPQRVTVVVLEGDPADAILDAATGCRCHAIVMGRGRNKNG